MHPAIHFLLAEGTDAASSSVKIALIGALAIVLAAAIPALLSLRERVPKELVAMQDERRLQDIEHDELDDKYHRLREFVVSLGYDPDTHQRTAHEEPL